MSKKEIVLTVRVDEEMHEAIQTVAEKDERTLAWTLRRFIEEGLERRGVWKKPKKKRTSR